MDTQLAEGTRGDTEGFLRVVCGIDGSREGFEAARQASRLTSRDGRLVLVAVLEFYAALSERWGPEPARRRIWDSSLGTIDESFSALRERARASLALAARQAVGAGEISMRDVNGDVNVRLLEAVDAEKATLLVVGTHGGRRLTGAAFGEATTLLLHEAPVPVLIARPPFDPERFPATIVAGVDGSPEARQALDVAAGLRERGGGHLTVVAATGDREAVVAALAGFDAPHELVISKERPVEALVAAAQTADLLVVGSRGLHGAKALGSVSERVAHRAPSSVLVVRRGPPPPASCRLMCAADGSGGGAVLTVNAGSTGVKLDLVFADDRAEPVAGLSDPAPGDLMAVGHRVVFGGSRFVAPVMVDDEVARELAEHSAVAPLHNAPALRLIDEARAAFPDIPHVAAFDTAFHATLPGEVVAYPVPERVDDRLGRAPPRLSRPVRRVGGRPGGRAPAAIVRRSSPRRLPPRRRRVRDGRPRRPLGRHEHGLQPAGRAGDGDAVRLARSGHPTPPDPSRRYGP